MKHVQYLKQYDEFTTEEQAVFDKLKNISYYFGYFAAELKGITLILCRGAERYYVPLAAWNIFVGMYIYFIIGIFIRNLHIKYTPP